MLWLFDYCWLLCPAIEFNPQWVAGIATQLVISQGQNLTNVDNQFLISSFGRCDWNPDIAFMRKRDLAGLQFVSNGFFFSNTADLEHF